VAQAFRVVVLISANAEWKALRELFQEEAHHSTKGVLREDSEVTEKNFERNESRFSILDSRVKKGKTPFGESLSLSLGDENILFVQGGWGKISAAASAQYAIDHWKPQLLVNLGTCGGFAGQVERGTILLVERTLVYDIIEQMTDFDGAIAHYATKLDTSWAGDDLPSRVQRSLLVSGDRDLLPEDIQRLKERYGAIAGDWESGAIAWVAERNHAPCLILRGVSDLVSQEAGETYGDYELFSTRTKEIIRRLVDGLPWWLDRYFSNKNFS